MARRPPEDCSAGATRTIMSASSSLSAERVGAALQSSSMEVCRTFGRTLVENCGQLVSPDRLGAFLDARMADRGERIGVSQPQSYVGVDVSAIIERRCARILTDGEFAARANGGRSRQCAELQSTVTSRFCKGEVLSFPRGREIKLI